MAGYPMPYGAPHIGYPGYVSAAFIPNAIPTTLPAAQVNGSWVVHVSHDGRKYYYNTLTQQTTWEKPQELKSMQEKILSGCPWKEFKAENGKPYFYNEVTQESVWVKPQELIEAENQANASSNQPNGNSGVSLATSIATPCTPATPKDDQSKPPEPSEIEKAMKATLASFNPLDSDADLIPLPSQKDSVDDVEDDVSNNSVVNSASPQSAISEYKTRGEMAEGLRKLFRDCNVPGNSTWEQALKLISNDPRYIILRTFNEKKQIFNVYKTQRQKEEKEEQRIKAKVYKENLERFLLNEAKIHSTMSYRQVDQLLCEENEWASVHDRDRRDIFYDVIQEIAKRERDEAKILRKRNIKEFTQILREMKNLKYFTTWSEAQQMLLDNTKFTNNVDLQNLDKEDALVCFENHICMLEQEHDENKERERRKNKREQRKNREAFIVLLEELHEQKLLTSVSLWKELYSIINRDERCHKMLAQRGSTPLDLFKFYVEALKARFPIEKKLIKEIMKTNNLNVDLSTTYEDFFAAVTTDERSKGLDEGNIRMTYNNLIDKAQNRERERQRDDARRFRKNEQNFSELLSSAGFIESSTCWEMVREKLGDHPAFKNLTLESERIRLFKEYIISLEDRDNEENRRARKERRRREKSTPTNMDVECVEQQQHKEKKKKQLSPASSCEEEISSSRKSDDDVASQKKKHRKSKKSKHRKSKHKHKSRLPSGQDDELEEGEAADDDDEEDDDDAAAGGHFDSKRHHHKHGRRSKAAASEDEQLRDLGDDGFYDRESKHKRR